jgi:hypothetical protein
LIDMSLISSEYCILRCQYALKDYCKLLIYEPITKLAPNLWE